MTTHSKSPSEHTKDLPSIVEQIRSKLLGHHIRRVAYFEINEPGQPFFYLDFDNFDLGIELEMTNGFIWHIGWKEKEFHEIGIGKFYAGEDLEDYIEVDATHRWIAHGRIQDISVDFFSVDDNLPQVCTLRFDDGESASIIVGEELNADRSLPDPLRYDEAGEVYVFHGRELPTIERVLYEGPPPEAYASRPDGLPIEALKGQRTIGFMLVLLILVLVFLKFFLGE